MDEPITQLTPDLWVARSRLYDTNSGILMHQGRAGLIDPALYPDEIEAIRRFVASRDATLDWIVLTHFHWDHVLGPEQFPGIPVVAQSGYLQAMEGANGDRIAGQIARWAAEVGISRPLPFSAPLPDETFATRRVLGVGGLDLQLVHAPGHETSQLVVYQPDRATLWAADMLSDLEIPFVFDSLVAYRQTLAMIASWDVRVLVPGHGHPTAVVAEVRSRIDGDRAYLDELDTRVQEAVRQGCTLAETLERCAAMHFRHAEENLVPHRQNVEHAYRELQAAGAGNA